MASAEANGVPNAGGPSTQPPVQTTEDLFNEIVHGKFPLSTNFGAVRNWVPTNEKAIGQYVPRPDASWTVTVALAILCLDHFYLRSPATGFWKVVTLGGAGIWWLWDLLQLIFEKQRVMNYGMQPPLDIPLFQPVGQGMMTDKETHYAPSYVSGWIFTELLAPLGLNQLFLGKYALTLFYLLLMVMPIGFIINGFVTWPTHTDFTKFLLILFGILFGYFGSWHVLAWFKNLGRLLYATDDILNRSNEGGLKVMGENIINPYFGKVTNERILFKDRTADQIKSTFRVRHESEPPTRDEETMGTDVLEMFGHTVGYPFWYLYDKIAAKQKCPEKETAEMSTQTGGARTPLSSEAQLLGAAVVALIAGGGFKVLVNTVQYQF